MAQQYRVTYMAGNNWKLPLNLAVGFHLLIGVSVMYLPDLFHPKPRYEDIYTVNLVNIAEQPPAPEQQVTPETQPQPSQPTPPEPEAVPIATPEPTPKPVEAAPPKAVSIKPLKKKKKNKIVKETPPAKTDADAVKRQKLAEMIKAQQEADQQARLLAEEAERERKLLQQTRQTTAAKNPSNTIKQPSTQARSGAQLNSIEKQYYATLTSRLQSLWRLPEYKQWDPNLSASVVITIRKSGEIADYFFERKSGDRIFDRFVMKTLQDVGNLPPIPPVLRKQRMEIGLIFSPGNIR